MCVCVCVCKSRPLSAEPTWKLFRNLLFDWENKTASITREWIHPHYFTICVGTYNLLFMFCSNTVINEMTTVCIYLCMYVVYLSIYFLVPVNAWHALTWATVKPISPTPGPRTTHQGREPPADRCKQTTSLSLPHVLAADPCTQATKHYPMAYLLSAYRCLTSHTSSHTSCPITWCT